MCGRKRAGTRRSTTSSMFMWRGCGGRWMISLVRNWFTLCVGLVLLCVKSWSKAYCHCEFKTSVGVQDVVCVGLFYFRVHGQMLLQDPDAFRVRDEDQAPPVVSAHGSDTCELARNLGV